MRHGSSSWTLAQWWPFGDVGNAAASLANFLMLTAFFEKKAHTQRAHKDRQVLATFIARLIWQYFQTMKRVSLKCMHLGALTYIDIVPHKFKLRYLIVSQSATFALALLARDYHALAVIFQVLQALH